MRPALGFLTLLACSAPDSRDKPVDTLTTSASPDTGTRPTGFSAADRVLWNGDFVTLNAASERRSAMAIRAGEIVWVGDEPVPAGLIGDATLVTDLLGRQVVPGLHDVHNHLLEAFHPAAGTCLVSGYGALTGFVPLLKGCADKQIGTEWVVGWGFDLWSALVTPGSAAEILDRAIPDRPAVIMETSSHAAWVNSAALAALGIDSDTPDPVGGVILRDAGGKARGLLLDAAGELAFDAALVNHPMMGPLNEQALRAGVAAAAENGITSVGDGRCFWKRGYVEAWQAVDAAGDLKIRAVVPLWAYPDEDDDVQIAQLLSLRSGEPGDRLRFNQVKLYADGITWLTTGALLEPYTGPTLAGPTGLNYFDAARLARYVSELEESGFDMHIHAIGDRGVREALDAIDAARTAHGDIGARHRLTHVEWVAPTDIPRFEQLGVAADFQLSGSWTRPQALHDSDFLVGPARIDERAWRVRDLYESGAHVVLSSDYDTASMSPFVSISSAIDRGDQSLPTVEAALRAMTTEAAWVLRQEDLVGSLEVGKRADLVVLDRDLFTVSPQEIAETKVLWTLLDGEETWRDEEFTP